MIPLPEGITPQSRSFNMSRIRSRNTKPEERVRKYLFAQGFRYRKNDPKLPGKPDIVLPGYRTCVFINGCFWHMHLDCPYFFWPKTNAEFWKEKIHANAERDFLISEQLKAMDWNVITVWECSLKGDKFVPAMDELIRKITESA